MKPSCLPPLLCDHDEQRWLLPEPLPAGACIEATQAGIPLLPEQLLAVLWRRGHRGAEAINALLIPAEAPDPRQHFPDLVRAEQRLVLACSQGETVAICGDYDADGMTSTALLAGVLQRLGANPLPAIPSRMAEGYGLNVAMVDRLAAAGVRLLITVDNGVAAREALDRAKELAVEVILTDHHTLPPELPPHLALLHPAVTPEDSPFRGLAGVGLAHVLASGLCRRLKRQDGLAIALDLFCIGTIADMAPLVGVNRRWLLDGLPRLGSSSLPGLKALQQIAGIEQRPLDAETVGFQLAPRINAVGRIGDPLLVVDLLTTSDQEQALELARRCETMNRQRRELCDAIEAEALALLEADGAQRPTFLLLAQSHWHHGVIGIVASRLVDRFGLPAALLAGEGNGRLRASVRAPKGFAVDRALSACSDLLLRHGGHPAAGGFTVEAEHVTRLHERLEALAGQWLGEGGGGRTVEPEALLSLEMIDRDFWQQQRRLEPFGIGHPAPIYWSCGCKVVSQKLMRGGHLQLLLEQQGSQRRAVAWRWQGPEQVQGPLDVAYRLRLDRWQGEERLQLEILGLRSSCGDAVVLQRQQRTYWCQRRGDVLVIRNAAGAELESPLSLALPAAMPAIAADLAADIATAEAPHHPYVQGLFKEAAMALGLSS